MERTRTTSPLLWIGILILAALVVWNVASQRVWVGVAVSVAGLTLPYLFAAWSFYRMVPRTVVLKPIAKACPEHEACVRELELIGFRPAVGPLLYNSRPPSHLSLLRHFKKPVYAAVLRVRVFGLRRVHFSYLSPIVGEKGHFESTATRELEAVRAPPWVRFQVLPGMPPDLLMEAHLATMARLRAAGFVFAVPDASELQREAIFSLALTGNYLRRNAYRLAAGLFAFAFTRRPRTPQVGKTTPVGNLLKRTPLVVRRGPYALCAWPHGETPPDAFFTVRDDLETTALVLEAELPDAPARVERGFAIVTLDMPMEWDVVGVLAIVTQVLALDGIPCGAVAAFSRDHLLVPVARLDEALAALAALCGEQRFE